jgi:hypothetical protein
VDMQVSLWIQPQGGVKRNGITETLVPGLCGDTCTLSVQSLSHLLTAGFTFFFSAAASLSPTFDISYPYCHSCVPTLPRLLFVLFQPFSTTETQQVSLKYLIASSLRGVCALVFFEFLPPCPY